MLLKVVIEPNQFSIDVPEGMIISGNAFFVKMDTDMDKGWQMNREWVAVPNTLQRCQIVADKLADAIESKNETFASLTAAYIMTQLPDVKEVNIDINGEMQETRFL